MVLSAMAAARHMLRVNIMIAMIKTLIIAAHMFASFCADPSWGRLVAFACPYPRRRRVVPGISTPGNCPPRSFLTCLV